MKSRSIKIYRWKWLQRHTRHLCWLVGLQVLPEASGEGCAMCLLGDPRLRAPLHPLAPAQGCAVPARDAGGCGWREVFGGGGRAVVAELKGWVVSLPGGFQRLVARWLGGGHSGAPGGVLLARHADRGRRGGGAADAALKVAVSAQLSPGLQPGITRTFLQHQHGIGSSVGDVISIRPKATCCSGRPQTSQPLHSNLWLRSKPAHRAQLS